MSITVLLIESTHYITIAELHPAVGLGALLPPFEERRDTIYLSAIDAYSDTFFNELQIDGFLREWRTLHSDARTVEERQTLEAVEELALRARDEHLILKFEGD